MQFLVRSLLTRPCAAAPLLAALPARLAILLSATALSGCLSYAVGTTARPLAAGERVISEIVEVMPPPPSVACEEYDGVECPSDGPVVPGVSSEMRIGLDGKSDLAVRVIGYSGFVASYKRLLSPDSAALDIAVIGGAGLINAFQHAELEATLVVSKAVTRDAQLTPYGGLRLMQALRLSTAVPRDAPTVGAFGGVRIGRGKVSVSPEIGVFYDRSALDRSRSPLIVVPSVAFVGFNLMSHLF